MPLDTLRPTTPRTLPPHHRLALSLSRADSSPSFLYHNAGLAERAHINARRRTLPHHHEHPSQGWQRVSDTRAPIAGRASGPSQWCGCSTRATRRFVRALDEARIALAPAAWRIRASRLRLCAGRSGAHQQSRRSQRLRLPMREALSPYTPCCPGASRARLSASSPRQSAGPSSGACAPRAWQVGHRVDHGQESRPLSCGTVVDLSCSSQVRQSGATHADAHEMSE